MSVLVVGSVAFDSVETPFGKHRDLLGGSASYFSISASYFTKVRMVAVVGKDFPRKHIDLFKKYGIDTGGLQVVHGKTFRWEGRYEHDMNAAETIATHLNVFRTFSPDIPRRYRDTRNIFLANIDPDIQFDILKQVRSPRLVASDTMNFWIGNKKRELTRLLKSKKIDLFLLNDAEARQFSGEVNLLRAARYILSLGPKMVIIKKGEHGSLFFSRKTAFSVPGLPLETICDPTGAGDTFAGGVMGYLSRFKNIDDAKVKRAIIYGSIMASFNVGRFSLKGLLGLNKQLIDKRYKSFKELTRF